MALMSFREANQVLWRGCRPAHNGTQVVASLGKENGNGVLYTVPVGNTLFLTSFSVNLGLIAVGIADFYVRNGLAVYQYRLFRSSPQATDGTKHYGLSFAFPIEVPATYDFFLTSSAAGLYIDALITGWVE